MGQGVGRVWRPPAPRVERTSARGPSRGPSPTSFSVLGLTRARQSLLWPDKSGWRGGGKAIEDVLSECAPHPAHAPYLTHACQRVPKPRPTQQPQEQPQARSRPVKRHRGTVPVKIHWGSRDTHGTHGRHARSTRGRHRRTCHNHPQTDDHPHRAQFAPLKEPPTTQQRSCEGPKVRPGREAPPT